MTSNKTPQPTGRPRAVLYSRLSRASLVSTSMVGQRDDLYSLAEREGWDIVAELDDEGKSGGKKRANAEAALAMLRDGTADVLAAYSVDRYSRQGIGEDAEVIRVVDAREGQSRRGDLPPALVYFAREGIRSDSGSDWRLRFALSSEMAKGERDVMVSRRKASIARMQTVGRYTGRGAEPLGYRSAPAPDGHGRILVVDPAEAAMLREVAERLIAGETATRVALDLTRRGVPTSRSAARLALLRAHREGAALPELDGLDRGTWTSSSLAQTMQSQYLLGRIVHNTARTGSTQEGESRRGMPVLGADGRPLQAFEPVLDLATFLALARRFDGGMGKGVPRLRRAARLGSGLVFCGYCGSKCYVRSSRGERYVAYRCAAKSLGVECQGVAVDAHLVEEYIERDFLAAFGRLPAVEYVELGRDGVAEELAALTDRIQALATAMTAPSADVLTLAPELAELQAERARLAAIPVETSIVARPLGKTWGELYAAADDVDTRRRYIAASYDHFDLYRADATRRVVPFVKPSPDEAPSYYGEVVL